MCKLWKFIWELFGVYAIVFMVPSLMLLCCSLHPLIQSNSSSLLFLVLGVLSAVAENSLITIVVALLLFRYILQRLCLSLCWNVH